MGDDRTVKYPSTLKFSPPQTCHDSANFHILFLYSSSRGRSEARMYLLTAPISSGPVLIPERWRSSTRPILQPDYAQDFSITSGRDEPIEHSSSSLGLACGAGDGNHISANAQAVSLRTAVMS